MKIVHELIDRITILDDIQVANKRKEFLIRVKKSPIGCSKTLEDLASSTGGNM